MSYLRACAALFVFLATTAVSAQAVRLDEESAYEQSQAAVGRRVQNQVLIDHNGVSLKLDELRGKPLVVSLVFTRCATVCPLTTEHVRKAVIEAQRVLGPGRFNVLTFGFDARSDRPAQLKAFASAHSILSIHDWRIASADEGTTAAFIDQLGFSFRAAAGGFDHVTQTTILDKDGVVYQQIYGDNFPLPVFIEPLKDVVLGTSTRSLAPFDLWDRVAFLCTTYNPATGAYRFDFGIFFGVFFGAVSLMIFAAVLVRMIMAHRRGLARVTPTSTAYHEAD